MVDVVENDNNNPRETLLECLDIDHLLQLVLTPTQYLP